MGGMAKKCLIALALVLLSFGSAQARDRILIVGSSTVFPFSMAVAETFSEKSGQKAPIVESTGTGGGLKLFCAGVGANTPDITNASRRIKKSELETCRKNGVTPVEVIVGYDGIVLANSKAGPEFDITIEQMFLALAKNLEHQGEVLPNPFADWSEIDPELPAEKIEVFGPPPTSGTRDAFEELVMEAGCKIVGGIEEDACPEIRNDGAYVESGENDDLIVEKLEANPGTVGLFGFSFLDQNSNEIQGAAVGSIEPSFENIASGAYPISRPLYFYVKKEHVGTVPGIEGYLGEFTAESAWGDDGYLAEKGLIPLTADQRKEGAARIQKMEPLRL
ncbi:phosphate ABC transporter substrate-binding protein [Roseibium polysiphoniae]|uniref:Phosphate ABC transporter substrate-binding protein n=1 Tax=Roseibium polysiphoniae TaxID=2571221 RepID=A0A944GTF6_9HYPH|nr:substrate-binding domain-containing protein [Roseibium polysiphoniae]MBS8261217.1 phosphate ABC transporter substrate-binding protein [Roseibium polysiphoniae]